MITTLEQRTSTLLFFNQNPKPKFNSSSSNKDRFFNLFSIKFEFGVSTMDIQQELDEYIKESINDSLGLPISTQNLNVKLRASEESNRRLRDQYLYLLERLRSKDELIERAKAEATMNALAVKKFVEENQRLAAECAGLVSQCNKWERECSLYDNDREALMDFGNEADERAKEAEIRVIELEKEMGQAKDELEFYKLRKVYSSTEELEREESLLDLILGSLINKDEVEVEACQEFLEANSVDESFLKLLTKWDSLRPSTQKALSLAVQVGTLQNDKEHIRINLARAEDEVNLLFQENKLLDKANKRLLRQQGERTPDGSTGKNAGNSSSESNKRRSSAKLGSPFERKNDFKDTESVRQPLSPLRLNSPDCRMLKR